MPKVVDKQEKRLAIIRSAMRVFARQGFSSARMDDIAREADIGKGTIYEYFRNKDELFFAVYEEVQAGFHETIYKNAECQKSAGAALEVFIVDTLKAFDQWREFGNVLLDFWSEHRRGENVNLRFGELYSFSRNKIAGFIEVGIKSGEFRKVDSMAAASVVIAVLDGILLQRIFDPGALGKTAPEEIAKMALNGLFVR